MIEKQKAKIFCVQSAVQFGLGRVTIQFEEKDSTLMETMVDFFLNLNDMNLQYIEFIQFGRDQKTHPFSLKRFKKDLPGLIVAHNGMLSQIKAAEYFKVALQYQNYSDFEKFVISLVEPNVELLEKNNHP